MKQNYFIMKMWQTGNVGSENIAKADNNPEDGFNTYEEAEQYLLESFGNDIWEFSSSRLFTFCIMKVYSK